MKIGSDIIFIKDLTSTNSYSLSLLKKETPSEGTIVYTNYQTGGRGQKGNQWESEDGKNLLFSIILYPFSIVPSAQFIISKAISLGICDFLKEYTTKVFIKWPNDIYINDDKIAGILIENSIMSGKIESTVAGIGININQKIFKSDAPNPVSLTLLTGKSYDISDCLKKLAENLDRRYKQLINCKYQELDTDYINKIYRLGEWHNYRDLEKSYFGRIVSITQSGMLQIEEQSGLTHNYSFGEVDFIQ
jgi:BirA family transcriptional regulator, biotin operon repressor / biotin---[acetyl-CoA-carboxylase] ligase